MTLVAALTLALCAGPPPALLQTLEAKTVMRSASSLGPQYTNGTMAADQRGVAGALPLAAPLRALTP